MKIKATYLLFVFVALNSFAFCQDEKEKNTSGLGISFNSGVSNSNNKESLYKFSYGLGVNTNFILKNKFSATAELEYNIRKEQFKDLKNYFYDIDGSIKSQQIDILKNYGLLDLKFIVNYQVYKINQFEILIHTGLGLNSLFWFGTKIDSENFETITNGQTQIRNTNPLTRPTFSAAPGLRFPFDQDKVMTLKVEYVFDYRIKSSAFTYPDFRTVRIKSQIMF